MITLNLYGSTFEVLNLPQIRSGKIQLPPIGAVYLFTKEVNGSHTIIYVGKTENLVDRDIPNHHKMVCVYLNQGNCFCIHPDADADSRKRKEEFFIEAYTPRCNDTPVK